MHSQKPLVPIPHHRAAWRGDERVNICSRNALLTGRELKLGAFERRKIYQAAKFHGNHDAAERLVAECISDDVVDRLIDEVELYMARGTPLVCVIPHPPFYDIAAGGADLPGKLKITNVLPLQYAAHLGQFAGSRD
jgi:hypothetical protein